MATIKSYTDLEQSKKLAEILPLESADMFWLVAGNTPRVHVLTEPLSNYSHWENYPCWSLAALLNVLPVTTTLLKDGNISNTGDVKYSCECSMINIYKWFDNAIDACYELILKLHKLNIL